MENTDYVKRIANATPLELIIISYELLLKSLKEAMDSIDHEPLFNRELNRAKGLLNELVLGLDINNPVAKQLLPIYIYANKLLINAGVTSDKEKKILYLKDAEKIFESLLPGWQGITEEDVKSAEDVMNHPRVYAGLTYGKGGEMEEYSTDSGDRGIKA